MSRLFFIKQHETSQCGYACLAMICRYYGKIYTLETLSKLFPIANEEISFLNINNAAERLGFHTIIGYLSASKLNKVTLPCILRWNKNHFVILHKVKQNKYYIADPDKGLLRYSESDFKKHWICSCQNYEEKGIAMFIKPTLQFYDNVDDSQKKSFSLRFIVENIKRFCYLLGRTYHD